MNSLRKLNELYIKVPTKDKYSGIQENLFCLYREKELLR